MGFSIHLSRCDKNSIHISLFPQVNKTNNIQLSNNNFPRTKLENYDQLVPHSLTPLSHFPYKNSVMDRCNHDNDVLVQPTL